MKIKKQLGSEAVQDLVEEARVRAQELPAHSVRDPWPSSQRVISEASRAVEENTPVELAREVLRLTEENKELVNQRDFWFNCGKAEAIARDQETARSFCDLERLETENGKLKATAIVESATIRMLQSEVAKLRDTPVDTDEIARLLRADIDQGRRIAELIAENERLQATQCKQRCAVTEADRDQYRDDYNEILAMLGVDRDAADCEHAIAKEAIRRLQAENEQLQTHLADALDVDKAERQRLWATLRVHPFVREENQRLKAENERLAARRDELLALVAKISQSTPLESEVAEALNQRGALLAEVGTLRAKLGETERICDERRNKSMELARALDEVTRTANARQAMLHDVNASCLLAVDYVKELADIAERLSNYIPKFPAEGGPTGTDRRIAEIRAAISPSKSAFALVEATRELVKVALDEHYFNEAESSTQFASAMVRYQVALAALESKS